MTKTPEGLPRGFYFCYFNISLSFWPVNKIYQYVCSIDLQAVFWLHVLTSEHMCAGRI